MFTVALNKYFSRRINIVRGMLLKYEKKLIENPFDENVAIHPHVSE